MRRYIFSIGLAACSGEPPCAAPLDSCTPEYTATFSEIHSRTFRTGCALQGCHMGPNPAASLDLDDPERAYQSLVGGGLVTAGDENCSVLVRRLEASSSGELMPPGSALREGVRCTIRRWIREGAAR